MAEQKSETISMPKEVYAAIKTLLDEFLWADFPERMKYFQEEAEAERNSTAERKEYQKAADQFEAAAALYEKWELEKRKLAEASGTHLGAFL